MRKQPSGPEGTAVRRMRPEDAEDLLEVYSQPGVIHGTLQLPHPSIETWRKRAAASDPGSYVLVATVDQRVVANLGLFVAGNPRRAHSGAIGMAVHDEFQGRGIGSALMREAVDLADRWLGLARLELEVFVDNEPAIRLYHNFGFEVEGTLRSYAARAGELADVLAMGRLRHRERS